MKKKISISVFYGTIASLMAIVIDILLKFTNAHLYTTSRYGLYFFTIILIGICIYLAIKKYRENNFEEKPFLFFHGFSIGGLTSLVYAIFFSLYLLVLSQTLVPDMFEKYKEQQIIAIENSTANNTEKNTQLSTINNMTDGSILFTDFIQRLIFPLIISLFTAIFMQQKTPMTEKQVDYQQKY